MVDALVRCKWPGGQLEESYANDPKVRAIVCPIDGEYGGRHNDGVHFDEPIYTTTDDYRTGRADRSSWSRAGVKVVIAG